MGALATEGSNAAPAGKLILTGKDVIGSQDTIKSIAASKTVLEAFLKSGLLVIEVAGIAGDAVQAAKALKITAKLKIKYTPVPANMQVQMNKLPAIGTFTGSNGVQRTVRQAPNGKLVACTECEFLENADNIVAPSKSAAPLKGVLYDNPSALVTERVAELKAAIPDAQKGRVTMAVAVVEDANGTRSVLVSTSEPRGYLRPGVTLMPGETMVPGTGHAEVDIANYIKAKCLKLVDIGATKPVCGPCQDVLGPTGANISTPLKKRPQ